MMRSLAACVVLALGLLACGRGDSAQLRELQRVKAGPLSVVLLSPADSLKQGKGGAFVLEFHDANGALVDVGAVTVSASMPMAGMAPMFGDCTVTPSDSKGRYNVASDLGMAGTWRLQVSWDGPAGKGSAAMAGSVI